MLIDDLIDRVIEECNGDVHGALRALLLLNERLETELDELREAVDLNSPDRRLMH